MHQISNLACFITLSIGWKRYLISFSSGLIGAFAMAPINFFPAMCIPMITAVWLIDGTIHGPGSNRSSVFSIPGLGVAVDGWWMGFGYFLGGLWWLGAAFFIEADKFGVIAPLAIVGLPAILGLFFSIGFYLSKLLWVQSSWRCLSLTVGLGVSEWLRSVLFTGFPWNNIGMSLAANLNFAQIASVVGLHGMTFIAVFVFSAFASLANLTGRGIVAPLTAIVVLACIYMGGTIRLTLALSSFEPDVTLRIVQPNIEQGAKFNSSAMDHILKKHLDLSSGAKGNAKQDADLISHFIWPESPFPVPLSLFPGSMLRIGSSLPSSSMLLTGAIRTEFQNDGRLNYYNSIHVISPSGEIIGNYDKRHLVPFGEYLPFADLLNAVGLQQLVNVPGGFSSGERPSLLRVSGLPSVAAMICYEAIFPRTLNSPSFERAGMLLNLTNDGWFGFTPGPYQHFSQARLRAIEEGLPMVRAANTGISAIIDPYGRVVSALPLGVEGVLDGPLPSPLSPTIFIRNPTTAPALVMFLFIVALFAFRPRV